MGNAESNFFEELEKKGFHTTSEQRERIKKRLNDVLTYQPRVGVFGKTGAGKSSLCNALFGTDICPISDVESCTRNPQEVLLGMGGGKGIKLVDVPGVGESGARDEEYGKLYASLLPELDLVLWVIKADDRALASDENFYKNIVKPHIDEGKPFFFVLNQVDKIEPFREWSEEKHEPGPKQFQNIYRKIDDVAMRFGIASSHVVPVSANERYNLTKLVDEFVCALPKEKKITMFRNVDEEFRSEATGEHVKQAWNEVVGDALGSIGTGLQDIGDIVSNIPVIGQIGGAIISGVGSVIEGIGDIFSGGCFITTATCKSRGKPDDCYELTSFRRFRDKWLAKQEGGKEQIDEYYRVAPVIVRNIDASGDSAAVYDGILRDYLAPCLADIEGGRYEECRKRYTQMVHDLEGKYLK